MPFHFIYSVTLLAVLGCAISQADRESDAIFAHQKWMRDSTGTVAGIVTDAATGQPIEEALVSAAEMGGSTDSSGVAYAPYLLPESVTVVADRIGYYPDSARALVRARDTVRVHLTLHRAPMPCCALVGKWAIVLDLDSAGVDEHPTLRRTSGTMVFSESFPDPFGGRGGSRDSLVRDIYGVFDVDFTSFWGSQVAPDASTTIFGPVTPTLTTEASARIFDSNVVSVTLIPRMTHGGASLGGQLHGDTIVGSWWQNAYCCGASGHFRMTRTSLDPGPIVLPPPIVERSPDTLADTARTDVRVRIWDDAVSAYIQAKHALQLPNGDVESSFATGVTSDGWGDWIKLPPGKYAVVIDEYPCGTDFFFLKKHIQRRFKAVAGQHLDITIRVNTTKSRPSRSYNNTEGKRCSVAPPLAPSGG